MVTDEDVRNADNDARESQDKAGHVRQQAIAEHRQDADNEDSKAEALE